MRLPGASSYLTPSPSAVNHLEPQRVNPLSELILGGSPNGNFGETSPAFGGIRYMNAEHFPVHRPSGLCGWRENDLEAVRL